MTTQNNLITILSSPCKHSFNNCKSAVTFLIQPQVLVLLFSGRGYVFVHVNSPHIKEPCCSQPVARISKAFTHKTPLHQSHLPIPSASCSSYDCTCLCTGHTIKTGMLMLSCFFHSQYGDQLCFIPPLQLPQFLIYPLSHFTPLTDRATHLFIRDGVLQ